jgi:hypothetical protein
MTFTREETAQFKVEALAVALADTTFVHKVMSNSPLPSLTGVDQAWKEGGRDSYRRGLKIRQEALWASGLLPQDPG